jgi:predicted AlkP superfamily phosphohydrolase/phosphomutase
MSISRPARHVAIAVGLVLATPQAADAYIGPGAGFALLSSFFFFVITALLALFSLIAWPVRMAWRILRRRVPPRPAIRRLIIIGLDGQDAGLTESWMRAGRLPNFQRLAAMGGYRRLRTTCPAVSPVAWSSFSTGTNPGRHNIFDFINRDPRTYLPTLSTSELMRSGRVLRLGRLAIPLRAPALRLLRRSRPFWSVLGSHGVWSTILRVPVTFPPDTFHGAQLSAMSVPDLRGTQGSCTMFTTRPEPAGTSDAGLHVAVTLESGEFRASLSGPDSLLIEGGPPLRVPLHVRVNRASNTAQIILGGEKRTLEPGRMSDWVTVSFSQVPGLRTSGICRLLLTELGEHVSLYVTPINIDPDRPAMPISHPPYYASYLAQKIGKFATLGMAEDTTALNDHLIEPEHFLNQVYDIDREREAMLEASLDRVRAGALVAVFDATDRVQHMCWRELETRGDDNPVRRHYEHNDALVGRALDRMQPGDLLMVLSDHGFTGFRRGINVNRWLEREGYLSLKPGTTGATPWLRDVDWSRTRAYCLGLSGLFINLHGRERDGIVSPGPEADALKTELITKLTGLIDPECGAPGITRVFDAASIYRGPYLANAPDCVIGYNAGYRTAWTSATGVVAGEIFEDNPKAWSGDHCVDPALVPGVLFSSRTIDHDDPSLLDIAPTALRLFGIDPPPYMEGTSLFRQLPPLPGHA